MAKVKYIGNKKDLKLKLSYLSKTVDFSKGTAEMSGDDANLLVSKNPASFAIVAPTKKATASK